MFLYTFRGNKSLFFLVQSSPTKHCRSSSLNASTAGLLLLCTSDFRSVLYTEGSSKRLPRHLLLLTMMLLKCCFKQMVSRGLAAFKCSIWAQKHQQGLEREYINDIKERTCLCAPMLSHSHGLVISLRAIIRGSEPTYSSTLGLLIGYKTQIKRKKSLWRRDWFELQCNSEDSDGKNKWINMSCLWSFLTAWINIRYSKQAIGDKQLIK